MPISCYADDHMPTEAVEVALCCAQFPALLKLASIAVHAWGSRCGRVVFLPIFMIRRTAGFHSPTACTHRHRTYVPPLSSRRLPYAGPGQSHDSRACSTTVHANKKHTHTLDIEITGSTVWARGSAGRRNDQMKCNGVCAT